MLEAADAFGLSGASSFVRVQLPLAMPMIMSGLRIAMVMIIGTRHLATLIGGGGLGTFIMLGIQTSQQRWCVEDYLSSALLALVFSWGIKLLSKLSLKRIGIVIASLIVIFDGIAGYGAIIQYSRHNYDC